MRQVGIGLYGSNGHQVSADMIAKEQGRLVGVCGISNIAFERSVKVYESLMELLSDPVIELVCVCSHLRSEQAQDIKEILQAGKHVYAEKPCVMTEEDLDEIIELAETHHVIFCEMAGCMYDRPYNKVRELVQERLLGEIVQIFVQKSYPYADFRPQDEWVDGGLILQNAIYGARFVEHIAGMEITEITNALETSLGNPGKGDLRMASALQMRLANGGIASVIANYLNQPGTGVWGNEELRIFGTEGYLKTNVEDASVDVFTGTERLHFESTLTGSLFGVLVDCIRKEQALPYTAEYLTHPTRIVLRAKKRIQE